MNVERVLHPAALVRLSFWETDLFHLDVLDVDLLVLGRGADKIEALKLALAATRAREVRAAASPILWLAEAELRAVWDLPSEITAETVPGGSASGESDDHGEVGIWSFRRSTNVHL